jgi:hypothetical protein
VGLDKSREWESASQIVIHAKREERREKRIERREKREER